MASHGHGDVFLLPTIARRWGNENPIPADWKQKKKWRQQVFLRLSDLISAIESLTLCAAQDTREQLHRLIYNALPHNAIAAPAHYAQSGRLAPVARRHREILSESPLVCDPKQGSKRDQCWHDLQEPHVT